MPSWKASIQIARYCGGPITGTGAVAGEGEGGFAVGTAVPVPYEHADARTSSAARAPIGVRPLRIDVLHNGGRIDVWLPLRPLGGVGGQRHRLLVDRVDGGWRQLRPQQEQRVSLAGFFDLLPRPVAGV